MSEEPIVLTDGASPVSVNQTIDELRKRFKPEAARNVNLTYLISVKGEGGGNWLVKIENQQCEFVPYDDNKAQMGNTTSPANCSISVDAADLELIISGRLSAMTAALSGVLSIEGELGQAMQLIPIFFESGF
jgi:putative sterol carrier protein